MRQRDYEGEVLAEPGRREHPNHDPERCADCVEQRETPPAHSHDSRHNAVQLTQHAEKSGEYHRHHAVADVDAFNSFEAFFGETDLRAMAQDRVSSERPAD